MYTTIWNFFVYIQQYSIDDYCVFSAIKPPLVCSSHTYYIRLRHVSCTFQFKLTQIESKMSSVSCLLIAFVIILWNIGQHSVQAKRFNFLYDIIFELHSNSSSIQQMTLSNLDGRVGRANPHDPSKILTFDYRRPTRIFIHGFYSNRDTLDAYAKAYREAGDYNFIAINWLEGAVTLNYKRARDRVKIVGETVARFIDYLVNEYGMALSDLVLIGHSLGAHACGAAGRNVKFGSVAAIVGLDPALPCFGHRHQAERLQQSDAEHVTVIHTNGGVFGISSPLGHADFFPNFGKDQPGCGGTVIGGAYSIRNNHIRMSLLLRNQNE